MPKKRSLSMTLVLIIMLLCSCTRPARLEELNIAYGVAFDAVEQEGHFKATYHIPVYQTDDVENVTVSAVGNSSKETQGLAELQLTGKFGDDKMKLILIDKKLAEKGINPLIQPFIKDRRVPVLFKMAITEQSAAAIIETNKKPIDPSTQIVNMITENENQNAIPTNHLHIFLRDWTSLGEDPFLPLLSMSQEKTQISGIALFKNDKVVDTIKGYKNLLLFTIIQQSAQNAKYQFNSGPDLLTARIKDNSVRYKWNNKVSPPQMDITVDIEALLYESTHVFNMPTQSEYGVIKQSLDQDLKMSLEKMLRSFQERNIDPIGIGSIARSKERHWNAEDWDSIYPTVQIKVHVNSNFVGDDM
ncbi:Ger(x)C family spore germination protein [Paenibacillus urinalis]|uniref:Ger(X)C family spore germination protein n=1 Tax=Paenibacillus urinalis TaxID=521520 RepID=A0AAX3MUQ2_9BACL|nr:MULTISPECIES: Ger(x)C family spore germination protein [Paenibacillus]WDH80987.1 Ger(x)C family spore germination protein [Paenibacillus urinalis]WDH97039.1 Ger(x)C family spore germination protein [Paenibacillus urinalis]WDI00701.1 Ger(x)C family spore germination protein [Paenibacillus urinalis]